MKIKTKYKDIKIIFVNIYIFRTFLKQISGSIRTQYVNP